jgi:hypothetical protein
MPSRRERFVADDKLTLRQASRRARLSRRQLAFLIRTGVIDANLENDALYRTSAPMQLFLF